MWTLILRFFPALAGRGRLVAVGVSVLGLLALGWYISNLKGNIFSLEKDNAVLASQLDTALLANESNIETITALENALSDLRSAVTVSEREAAQAAIEAARREAEARDRLNNTITELEELRNAEPSCEAIADLDIGAACPAAVQRLREQAEAGRRN